MRRNQLLGLLEHLGAPSNQAPTVAITAPANNATVSGVVSVTADAADADGSVARVDFELPDGSVQSDTAAPFAASWNSAAVANGAYLIRARAFAWAGAER